MPIRPSASPTFLILSVKLQTPRSTRTILPAREPGANESQPSRLPPAPSPYCTGAWTSPASGTDQGWNTAGKVPMRAVGAVICISGWKPLGTAVCATDRAVFAPPGVPFA